MKSGNHIILGKIDQDQSKQFFHPARGDEIEKLYDTMVDHGMIRYNSTIDRLEGVVRSIDSTGRVHPGRWSPFTTVDDLGVCDPDASDVFAAYIGTVLNSAEISKSLTINVTGGGSGEFTNYPVGQFLGSDNTKDANDPAYLVSNGQNIHSISVVTDETSPQVNINVPARGGHGFWSGPGSISLIELDLFSYFDIPTNERRFFYITPYMCLNSVYFNVGEAGVHNYTTTGCKGNIRPVGRDPNQPNFGKFLVNIQTRAYTKFASYSLYLTANRFDNFIPTCDNPIPAPTPPPLPDPLVIHCREDQYNSTTRTSCNVRERVEAEYWQWIGQAINVRVEVHPGAEVHGRRWKYGTYGMAAIDTTNLPEGSTVTVNNQGTIVGGGGVGGHGSGYKTDGGVVQLVDPQPGGPGEDAILGDEVELIINNTADGHIIHGTGGGGGAHRYTTFAGDVMAGGNGGGGISEGLGGYVVYGDKEVDQFDEIIPSRHDGKEGGIDGGPGGTPIWMPGGEQYRLWNNDALVYNYGVFNRYNATGASGGQSYTSPSAPAQGVILLNNSVPDVDSTLTIGSEQFEFKSCPTDTRTCWDGTVYSRDPANDCKFPECPIPPQIDYVRDAGTKEPLFQTSYRLLEYAGDPDTEVDGEFRIQLDNTKPINFPDPTRVRIQLSVTNEKYDIFEIDTLQGDGFQKTAEFFWDVNQSGFTIEGAFKIRANELTDVGDPDTILDGSPYYADLKLEMLGFSNTTVGQLELSVSEPATSLSVVYADTELVYEQTATDGNTYWFANQTARFAMNGNAIRPDGVTIDCNTGAWSLRNLTTSGSLPAGDLGIIPQTVTANLPSITGMPVDERIGLSSMNLVPYDYIDSYVELKRIENGGVRFDGSNIGHSKTDDEMLVECWFRVGADSTRGNGQYEIIFNKEASYEIAAVVTGNTFRIDVAVHPNTSGNSWEWKDTGFVGNVGRAYHIGLLLKNPGTDRDTLYVDGTRVWSRDDTRVISNNTNMLSIGCRGTSTGISGQMLTGDVTEFRVWHGNNLDQLYTTYRNAWSRRMHNGSLNGDVSRWVGPGKTLRIYKPLSTANISTGTTPDIEYVVSGKDLTHIDMNRPGLLPDPIPTGISDHVINYIFTDNSSGDVKTGQKTVRVNKIVPFTMVLTDADGNQPAPTTMSKMYKTSLDEQSATIRISGTGIESNKPISINGEGENGQRLQLITRPHPQDTNNLGGAIGFGVSNDYPLDAGVYSLLIEVKIQDIQMNDTFGIQDDIPCRLSISYDGDTVTHDMTGDLTQGNVLTKTFTAADTGYNATRNMLILRNNDLLQHGPTGLDNQSSMACIIVGGSGGGGCSDQSQMMNGGTGRKGNTLTTSINNLLDADQVEIKVGNGGAAGVSGNGNTAAGGITGSEGTTGGSSTAISKACSLGHANEYRSGGGGGGYTQFFVDSKINAIAGGGSGGAGAYNLTAACDGVHVNPIPGQGCVFPDGCEITDFNGDNITTFDNEIITIGNPFQPTGTLEGENGLLLEPHNTSPIVGVIGGGGGGSPFGGIAGWCGSGGLISSDTTPADTDGDDGSVTVQFRGYTTNPDEVVSLQMLAGAIEPPAVLSSLLDDLPGDLPADSVGVDQIAGAIPANTPVYIRAVYSQDASGDNITRDSNDNRIDPMGALYNNDGELLNSNDDKNGLLPGFAFPNGLAADTYWFVLSKFTGGATNNYTNDNWGLFETDKIINFPISFIFSGMEGNGVPNDTIYGRYDHIQDTTSRHVICSCLVV